MSEPFRAAPPGFATRLRRKLRELGPAAPLLLFATVGPLLGLMVLVSTTAQWLPWFDGGAGSMIWFVIVGAVAAAGCLLPTHATSLVAGFTFGAWLGAGLAWLVIAAASVLAYAVWQPLVGERALRALAGSPRALLVRDALLGRGFLRTVWVIALLRLSPVMPFAVTNLLLAAFGVRGPTFLVATVIGITPRAVGAAWIGAELSTLDWRADAPPWSTLLAIVATVAVVVVVGRTARMALRRGAGADTP